MESSYPPNDRICCRIPSLHIEQPSAGYRRVRPEACGAEGEQDLCKFQRLTALAAHPDQHLFSGLAWLRVEPGTIGPVAIFPTFSALPYLAVSGHPVKYFRLAVRMELSQTFCQGVPVGNLKD